MAGAPINTGFNYLAAAQSALEPPAPSQGGPGGDTLELLSAFKPMEETEKLINKNRSPEKPGVETAYVTFSKVFCLWRDYAACPRCQNAIASGHAMLPADEGDYDCPHNQSAEYKELLDSAMRGDITIVLQDRFPTMIPPARYCHVEWLAVDPDELRRMKRREENKKNNAIYPPDVAAAFRNP
jgi:hypothetical protein